MLSRYLGGGGERLLKRSACEEACQQEASHGQAPVSAALALGLTIAGTVLVALTGTGAAPSLCGLVVSLSVFGLGLVLLGIGIASRKDKIGVKEKTGGPSDGAERKQK